MPSKREIEAGRAFVRLFLKNDLRGQIDKAFKAVGSVVSNAGRSITKVGAVAAASGTAALAPLMAAVTSFASVGDDLDKTALRTGIAAQSLAELGFAAEQSGTDLATVERGAFGLSRAYEALQRGQGAVVDAFGAIGLKLSDLKGLTPEQQLEKVAAGLSKVEDASIRGAVAQQLLGRAGRQLLPMFADLGALRQEARELGLVPSEKAVKDAAAVTDAMNRIKRSVEAVWFQVGAKLAPIVLDLGDRIKNLVGPIRVWVENNGDLIRGVALAAAGLAAFGFTLVAVGGSLVAVGATISALGTIVAALLSPFSLLAGALTGGVVLWAKYTESGQGAVSALTTAFGELKETALAAFGGIADALLSGEWQLAGDIAMTGLQVVVAKSLGHLSAMWGDTIGAIGGALINGDIVTAGRVMWLKLKAQWLTGIRPLREAWVGATHVIGDVFISAINVVRSTWVNVTSFIASSGTKILGFLLNMAKRLGIVKEGFDTESVLKVIEEDRKAQLSGITKDTSQQRDRRAENTAREMREIAQQIAEAQAEADRLVKQTGAAIADDVNVEALNEKLASLTKRAAQIKAEQDKGTKEAKTQKAGGGLSIAGGGSVASAGQIGATFNAASAIAAGFGAIRGPSPQIRILQQIAKASEATVSASEKTAQTNQAIADGLTHGA